VTTSGRKENKRRKREQIERYESREQAGKMTNAQTFPFVPALLSGRILSSPHAHEEEREKRINDNALAETFAK
jgi:hypothetical protein